MFKNIPFSSKGWFFFLSVFFLFSFKGDSIQKKVIRNKDYDIHFYVSLKKRNTTKNSLYFWYKSGEIHTSFGDAAGELLHKEYVAYYKNNQLAEKGKFSYGLKKGKWKKWHSNGALQEITSWKNGNKNGKILQYDNKGNLILKGQYLNNKKNGVWVTFPAKDTTWFKKGVKYIVNPKRIKKSKDSLKRVNDSINGKIPFFKKIFKTKDTSKSKTPFFKRVFGKNKNKQ